MAYDFEDLAHRTKQGWSASAHRVYAGAASAFGDENRERADLGAQVAAARRALSLTQAQLSELTGMQQAEISRIERGVANPTVTNLVRLGSALQRDLTFTPSS